MNDRVVVDVDHHSTEFNQNEIAGPCPYCGADIKTSDTAIRLECPACNRIVVVRDLKLYPAEG